MAETAPSLTSRIRTALAASHDAIERLPLAVRLAQGTVTQKEYICLLHQLWCLHRALEEAFASDRVPGGLFAEEHCRTETIARDLVILGASETAPYDALSLTERVQHLFSDWSQNAPWRLWGALYVFEGSRMGSMFLGPAIARAFHRPAQPHQGVDYHLDGINERPRQWKAFKQTLDEVHLDTHACEEVLVGAVATMNGLLEIYAALGSDETITSGSADETTRDHIPVLHP